MKLWIDLFSTDYGLMSLVVIVLIQVMAVFFTCLFMGKMKSIAADAPEHRNPYHLALIRCWLEAIYT